MLGICFYLQYFVPFLVLQSSRWERAGWLLYFCCVLNVMSLFFLIWLFLAVPWVDLLYGIVVFLVHTHILFTMSLGSKHLTTLCSQLVKNDSKNSAQKQVNDSMP